MRIDPKSTIAGQPALKVRDFLYDNDQFSTTLVAEDLGIPSDSASKLIAELVRMGVVGPDQGEGEWKVLDRRLALATGAKPLQRATAEKKVQELLGRIHDVNRNDQFAYRVAKAVVFGSYLSEKERINDIDVAIALAPREKDRQAQNHLEDQRIRDARRSGREFHNIPDEMFWPQHEVLLFLKARSRALSFHHIQDLRPDWDQRVIFEEG